MKARMLLLILFWLVTIPAFAAPPVVTNIRPSQIAGTKNIEILFDVSDADGDALTIGMQVSGDAGVTYTIPATALSGHIGAGVTSGVNRRIVWNVGADWNGQLVSNAKVRVTASDSTTPAPPPGMVYIPAGVFQMGDNLFDGGDEERPVHNVYLDGFFIDKFEVKHELFTDVATWAQARGYSTGGGSKGVGFPIHNISWYAAVIWCNARSEKEGLIPCYYTDTAQTLVYRSGNTDVTNAMVNWVANGYRLPTEAEWEKAARGGMYGKRYPWGDTIDGSMANYLGSGDPYESQADPDTTPVGYYNGSQTPSGTDMANSYGLYDMAGNVWERCWDWYSATAYGLLDATTNPHGPTTGTNRVVRGGGWKYPVSQLRCAYRLQLSPGSNISNGGFGHEGFRCVRKTP